MHFDVWLRVNYVSLEVPESFDFILSLPLLSSIFFLHSGNYGLKYRSSEVQMSSHIWITIIFLWSQFSNHFYFHYLSWILQKPPEVRRALYLLSIGGNGGPRRLSDLFRITQLLQRRGRMSKTRPTELPPLQTQPPLILWCAILIAVTTTNTGWLHFNDFSFKPHHNPAP